MAIHAPITGAPTRAIQLPPVLAFIMGLPIAPREAVERTIQAAIDALDQIDGDAEAEDGEGDKRVDERDFAWIERQDQDRAGGREGRQAPSCDLIGNGEDAEDDDGGESGGDDEDVAWVERDDDRQDGLFAGRHEDAEHDDPAEASVQPAVTALAAANDA